MRRLVLSMFLPLLFLYLAFLLLGLQLQSQSGRIVSRGGFILDFYTHSKGIVMDPVLDGVR